MTKDDLKSYLPRGVKVSDSVLSNINEILEDENSLQALKENMLSYMGVLKDPRFKISDYLNAVKYVTYKLHGSSNTEAYAKTFPDKWLKLLNNDELVDRAKYAHVSAYNNTKLVNLILEQTLVPTYILNADIYQKAINVQADLMMNAKSEKVRTEAANSLLNHLKRPEATKVELSIGIKEDGAISELRNATMALVKQQRELLESGLSTAKEIAHSTIIEGEIIDED